MNEKLRSAAEEFMDDEDAMFEFAYEGLCRIVEARRNSRLVAGTLKRIKSISAEFPGIQPNIDTPRPSAT